MYRSVSYIVCIWLWLKWNQYRIFPEYHCKGFFILMSINLKLHYNNFNLINFIFLFLWNLNVIQFNLPTHAHMYIHTYIREWIDVGTFNIYVTYFCSQTFVNFICSYVCIDFICLITQPFWSIIWIHHGPKGSDTKDNNIIILYLHISTALVTVTLCKPCLSIETTKNN